MPRALHEHQRPRAGQPVDEGLRLLDRDAGIRVAMDHQRGTGDLCEPVGDVLAGHQRVHHLRRPVVRHGRPEVLPRLLVRAGPEDRCGREVQGVLRGPVGRPGRCHPLVQRQYVRLLGAGLGVDEQQREHPVGSGQRGAQGQEAALAHPGQHGLLDAKVVQDRQHVRGAVPVRPGPLVLGLAVSAFVPRHDPVGVPERLDLRREHRMVHQQSVAEHDHGAVAAGVGQPDGGAGRQRDLLERIGDDRKWHVPQPTPLLPGLLRRQPGSPAAPAQSAPGSPPPASASPPVRR